MAAIQLLALLGTLSLLLFVVEAIRRGRLKERYALLWLGASAVLLLLSLARPWVDWLAVALGIRYGTSLIFLMAFFFLLLIVLHYSLVISEQSEVTKRLAQRLALLEAEIEELRCGRR